MFSQDAFTLAMLELRPGCDWQAPPSGETAERLAAMEWNESGAAPPTLAELEAAMALTAAPQKVTNLQMRRALRQLGKLAAVNAYVATQSDDVKDSWEYGAEIPITSPMVIAAATALGVDLAALFILAATL